MGTYYQSRRKEALQPKVIDGTGITTAAGSLITTLNGITNQRTKADAERMAQVQKDEVLAAQKEQYDTANTLARDQFESNSKLRAQQIIESKQRAAVALQTYTANEKIVKDAKASKNAEVMLSKVGLSYNTNLMKDITAQYNTFKARTDLDKNS